MCHSFNDAAPSHPFTVGGESSADNRLLTTVLPTHYAISIKTDLELMRFDGSAEISLELSEAVPAITLNVASPLVLHNAVLSHSALKTESVRPAVKFDYNIKRERVTISFAGGEIAAGKATIGLRFDSILDPSMMGYYASTYPSKDVPGGTSAYALTQFEPTAARRAFPCFDEPEMKATYAVTLVSRVGTTSLSNMNVTSTKHTGENSTLPRTELLTEEFFHASVPVAQQGGKTVGKTEAATETTDEAEKLKISGTFKNDWEVVTFATTPKVSSYLVAYANGIFESIEDSYISPLTKQKIPMKVYTTYEHIKQAGLALETKVRIMPIYETMFDIAYPLPKLDTLVAADFSAGAMENWGLITGRTSVYLYDAKQSGIAARKRVIGVQSHEVAHQWFGNITTMCWWDNLWLNEAFATLIGECIMIEAIEPSWKVHSSFIGEHLSAALRLDSLRSSHPIELPCPDEETIAQIFDAVSYSKGASVLRMLSSMVGEDVFIKGVSIYLKAHLYGNAKTADLWAGIAKSSGQDVAAIMANWTQKIGFPVITVEETEAGLKIRQNRFLSTGDPTPEEDTTIWHVPLELKTIVAGKVEVDHKAVLTTRETVLPLQDVANAIYKLNAETTGVYRTLYSPQRLSKLGDEAGKVDSSFSLNDRMGLIQDTAVLASAGLLKTSAALTFISKLGGESENLVWQEISSALAMLAGCWWEQPENVREGVSKLRRELFVPLVEKLGFEYAVGEDADTIELRTMAISVAAVAGDKNTLAEYKRRFGLLLDQNDESGIPSDLRGSIYGQSVKYGGEKEYQKMLEIYRNPPTPSHKNSAMSAMCATRDPVLIKQTFEFIFSPEVKTQDWAYFFGGLANNPVSKRDTWKFYCDNYDVIIKRLAGDFSIGNIVKASFSSLSTEKDALAVETYFKTKDTAAYAQPLAQGLDSVRSKAGWLHRDVNDVYAWLEKSGRL